MTHIYSSYVTTTRTVPTNILQALYYSRYYVSMTNIYSSHVTTIHTIATTITALRPTLQQLLCPYDLHLQLLRHYELYYRNNYYVTKAYITATAMSL